ncbi:MAG: hypothetical protein V4592_14075 [Bacteroidota bacterium]
MNNPTKIYPCLLLLAACIAISACRQPPKPPAEKPRASFKSVRGIGFTEVRRCFGNGYSFNNKGYSLEPNWRLSFPSDDSVNIYNPKRKRFVNAPLLFDHDSVFNIAWAYLRLKKLTKDSIKFQVLRVNGRVIDNDGSDVYMTLYANDYIKNVLHKDPLNLPAANRRDTLLIKKLTEQARLDPHKAFAARQIARLISKTPLVKVETIVNDDRSDTDTDGPPIDYLSPEYHITISKAYDDFSYYFTIYVDENGQISFGKPMTPLMPPFSETYPRIMKAITNGYLKAYLKIIPGTTLGIAHTSEVIVFVKGTKS